MPYVRSWMVMMSMCLVFTDAFATHMKGGELTYEDLGGGQYLIRLVVYRDCGSNNANGTGFDVVAPIGIFNSSGQLINSISIPLSIDNIEEIAYLTADTCTAIPASLCIQQATYEQQVELGVYAGGADHELPKVLPDAGLGEFDGPRRYWSDLDGDHSWNRHGDHQQQSSIHRSSCGCHVPRPTLCHEPKCH